jgi:hypothetical protein
MERGVFLILFILCVPISLGLGLQYTKINELFFEPNMQYTKEFTIVDYAEGMGVNVSVTGALAEYASLSEVIDVGNKKKVILYIDFPEYLSPGTHLLTIMAKEVPLDQTGTIAVVIETGKVIKFWALDPGKFALFDFSTENLNVNESINFSISASSYGEQTINDIYGIIEILFNGEIVKTIESEHISLESKEKKRFKAEFDAFGFLSGDYVARLKILWGNNETIIEKEFRIGSLDIVMINFTKEIIKANIAEMFVEIESKWNNDVEGINAEIFIDGLLVGKSLNYDLEKWGKKSIPVYINLKNIETGEHDIDIVLNYEGGSSFLSDNVNILDPPKKMDWVRIGLISFIIILIISLIDLWILTFKKKK